MGLRQARGPTSTRLLPSAAAFVFSSDGHTCASLYHLRYVQCALHVVCGNTMRWRQLHVILVPAVTFRYHLNCKSVSTAEKDPTAWDY